MSSSLFTLKTDKVFSTGPAPHFKSRRSSRAYDWGFFASLLPLWCSSFLIAGWRGLLVPFMPLALSAGLFFSFDSRRQQKNGWNQPDLWSAALMFGLLGSVLLPLWLVAAGTILLFVFMKMSGGARQALFYPPLVTAAVLMTFFPEAYFQGAVWASESVSGPGPSGSFAAFFVNSDASIFALFSFCALLLGAEILLFFRLIRLDVLIAFFLSTAAGFIMGQSDPMQVLSEPVFFTAFYLISNPIITPVARQGRVLFGVLTALVFVFLQIYYRDAIAVVFSVFLMQMTIPAIDFLSYEKKKNG